MEEEKKKLFGRGIYGSKDVPIRILDGLIVGMILLAVVLTVIFSINGGYRVTFDTRGGGEIPYQKLRYGKLVEKPEEPQKPGYEFVCWKREEAEGEWSFEHDQVKGDMTLTAQWKPASVLVKFDLDGGTVDGKTEAEPVFVTYGEVYGALPEPEKTGVSVMVFKSPVLLGDITVLQVHADVVDIHILIMTRVDQTDLFSVLIVDYCIGQHGKIGTVHLSKLVIGNLPAFVKLRFDCCVEDQSCCRHDKKGSGKDRKNSFKKPAGDS